MSRSNSAPGGRRAFSFMEVLVVLAIVAALLSAGLVAFQDVNDSMSDAERDQWRTLRRWGGKPVRRSPIKILFIGNSYTSTNDLPGVLRSMTQGQAPELRIESLAVGGATLESHWNDGMALEKIRSSDWDFVVLQEQSQRPLARFGRDQLFYAYARKFDDEIKKAGAITLFFMTWARPDTPGPQKAWTESFLEITKELQAECAPAGLAMEKAKAKLPKVTWLADTGGHPTGEGTYLAACAFYTAIYDERPPDPPSALPGLSSQDAATVRACVWDAMREVKTELKREGGE